MCSQDHLLCARAYHFNHSLTLKSATLEAGVTLDDSGGHTHSVYDRNLIQNQTLLVVGRHHRLSGQEFEQAQGDSEVKDRVAWHAAFHGVTASDTTEQLNTNNISSALGRVSWSNPGA